MATLAFQTTVYAEQCLKALAAETMRIERKVLPKALKAGVRQQQIAAKSKAGTMFSQRTGLLRKSLKTSKYKKRSGKGVLTFKVMPDPKVKGEHKGKKAWPVKYSHLVELGHRIAASRAGGRSAKGFTLLHKRTGRMYGKTLAHHAGNVSPRPFLLASFNVSRAASVRAFADKIAEELRKTPPPPALNKGLI